MASTTGPSPHWRKLLAQGFKPFITSLRRCASGVGPEIRDDNEPNLEALYTTAIERGIASHAGNFFTKLDMEEIYVAAIRETVQLSGWDEHILMEVVDDYGSESIEEAKTGFAGEMFTLFPADDEPMPFFGNTMMTDETMTEDDTDTGDAMSVDEDIASTPVAHPAPNTASVAAKVNCPTCNLELTRGALPLHMKSHDPNRENHHCFITDGCDFSTHRADNLVDHLRKHHFYDYPGTFKQVAALAAQYRANGIKLPKGTRAPGQGPLPTTHVAVNRSPVPVLVEHAEENSDELAAWKQRIEDLQAEVMQANPAFVGTRGFPLPTLSPRGEISIKNKAELVTLVIEQRIALQRDWQAMHAELEMELGRAKGEQEMSSN